MTNVLQEFCFLRLFFSCSFISLFYVRLLLPACIIKPRCNNTRSALNEKGKLLWVAFNYINFFCFTNSRLFLVNYCDRNGFTRRFVQYLISLPTQYKWSLRRQDDCQGLSGQPTYSSTFFITYNKLRLHVPIYLFAVPV